MAPLPKAEGTRVRRNLGQKQWRTVTRGAVKVPPMPGATRLESDVRTEARRYWKALWTDLGEIYTDADRYPLARLCILNARVALGQRVGAQLQAELRQLEANYGATPTARQRLMVIVAEPTAAPKLTAVAPVAEMDEHRQRTKDRRARITGKT